MSNPIINTIVFPIIRQDFILPALKSLKVNTPPNYKTIVVNQTTSNEEFERALYDSCDIVIRPHFNMGFAQAANWGMRLAPTPYVTVANDDILFLDNWWQGCMETFERFETAAAVCPMTPKEPGWGWGEPGYRHLVPRTFMNGELKRLYDEDRELMAMVKGGNQSATARYHDTQSALDRLILEASSDPAFIQSLVEEKNWAVVDAFATFCPVFRADRLAEVGMIDERFFPGGGEDYDLMARYYQAGYRMLSTSRSFVWHWWGKSKDSPDGRDMALPPARPNWNNLSALWTPRCDVWGKNCERKTDEVFVAGL